MQNKGAAPPAGHAEVRVVEQRTPEMTVERILDLALDAILVRDREGVISYWSPGAERLYGWSAAEAIGRRTAELLATDFPHGEEDVLGAVQKNGSWLGELIQTTKDDRLIYVESRWVPDRDDSGEVVRYLEVNRDVTNHRATRQRFRQLLHTAPDAVVVVDTSGRIMFTNEQAHALFGYSPEELTGEQVEILLPEAVRVSHVERRQTYMGTPHRRPMGAGIELAGRRKDGTEFPVEIMLSPTESDRGMLVSAVIRDITERKRTERRLAEQAVALARSNAELEQFAYVASHDLQEPLRKIASFCSLLKADYGGELDEMADTYIDYAVDGAIRMQALIRDLLEYSRVARREVRLEPVDVRAAVDTALRNLDAMREEADVALLIDAMPTIPAERSQLVQLYQNLIANAIKFRAPGRRCEIEVGSRPDAGGWLFWVRDNGIGIDQSHTDQVFEMFRRLHARTEFAGTGIGLAICRRIVERMGGRIWVESAPGAGATFWWTVPMKQAT